MFTALFANVFELYDSFEKEMWGELEELHQQLLLTRLQSAECPYLGETLEARIKMLCTEVARVRNGRRELNPNQPQITLILHAGSA